MRSLAETDFDAHRGLANAIRVRVASTANLTIASALNSGDSLDGVTLADGDLVLLKDQSAGAENGIYVVGAVPVRHAYYSGRETNLTAAYDRHAGLLVVVREGTTNADTTWLCTSNTGGTLDTTALAFTRMLAAVGAQPLDATLTALAAFNTNGVVVQTAADTFAGGIKNLPAETAAATDDLLAISDTSESSGTDNHITIANFFKVVTSLTAETSVDTADEFLLYDASAGTADKATVNNVFKAVNTFTAETAVDTADVLPLYDASAATADKATVNELFKAVNTFTAETAVDTADVLPLYDASAGTADKATVNELFKAVNSFTAETAVDTADVLSLYDASAGTADKATVNEVFKAVNTFASETSVATDDVLFLFDTSVSGADKTTIANLRSPLGLLSSSTDNTVPRFDSTGGNLQTSGVTISDSNLVSAAGGYTTSAVSIADDAATSFTPPSAQGFILVYGGAVNGAGLVSYNTGGPAIAEMTSGSTFDVTTGALTGTTGTDGRLTVSAHVTDGKIYIENRLGFTATSRYTFLSTI